MRICRRIAIFALFALALSLGGCASFGPFGAPGAVVPDRPGYTDTPTVLPAHAVQLETGATDDVIAAAAGSPRTEYISLGEVLLRAGIGARTELRLFVNSYGMRNTAGSPTASGMEDVKIGVKVRLRSIPDSVHRGLPNAALLVATTLPSGASGISAGAAQPEAKLAVNWTTPTPLSIYANLAYGAIETGSGHASRAWTSVAGWWAVNPKVSVMAEGLSIGRVSGSGSGTSGSSIDAGVTYLVSDRLQLDARIGRGVGSESERERFIGVGFAQRW